MGRSQGGLSKLPQGRTEAQVGLSAVICGHVPPATRGRHVLSLRATGVVTTLVLVA